MNLNETGHFVLAMNQQDPRIQANNAADKTWYHSVAILTTEEAWQAWIEYKRSNANVPQPNEIRRAGLAIRSLRQARQRAIEPPRKQQADPRPDKATWERLMAQGKAAWASGSGSGA
jgi:hypothetical protein